MNLFKENKRIKLLMFIFVIMLFVMGCSSPKIKTYGEDDIGNIEYTNNSGDKLPIVVNQISIQNSYYNGYIDIIFEIENLTKTEYRNVNMAVLAWDSDGFPIKNNGMFVAEADYVNYIGIENIGSYETDEYSYTFETADIKYMSVFLSYYEDFENNKWENPIINSIEKNKGNKLDRMEIYYFEFQ